jgi:hypothetical protein
MLSNKTSQMQVVKIIRADGTPDSINLQPNVRNVTPPKGSIIDPIQYSSYVGVIGGIENYAPPASPAVTTN